MLMFNNLLINKSSDRFQPFLLNLLSGRRRLLNNDEIRLVKSMNDKGNLTFFSKSEFELYNKLIIEKQFLTDERRSFLEEKLIESGYFNIKNKYAEDYRFSIELTRSCNMDCSYCYAHSRLNNGQNMTRNHVDAIFEFYSTYANNRNAISETPYIRITGGEPLINKGTVDLINYIASKWKNSRLLLFTNGVNLLKYYDCLPLSRIEEIHVSIDGVKDVHIARRYSDMKADDRIYDKIILGVQKLLTDKVKVKVKAVLDKANYQRMEEFDKFMEKKGISDSPYYEFLPGLTLDYQNLLDISDESHNKNEVRKIQMYMAGLGLTAPTFPSYSTLFNILNRPKNEPYMPKHQRCNSQFLANYYFSSNGKVYFCDCIRESDGVVGTYFPRISIDETVVYNLLNRSVMGNERCRKCVYKFVCLGGCPISARTKNTEMACGIYADEDILDNLEFDYYCIG